MNPTIPISLFQGARAALETIQTTPVIRERLALAFDQAAILEGKVSELQSEVGELRAEARIARTNETLARDELNALKKLHEEEIVIGRGIEFRRGKRTLGKWLPFCPVCHLPILGEGNPLSGLYCDAHKAIWNSNLTWAGVPAIIASFGENPS